MTESIDLGVVLAEILVPPLADNPVVANDDGPDQRVRLDPAAATFGKFESPGHEVDVGHPRSQGTGVRVQKQISISSEPT